MIRVIVIDDEILARIGIQTFLEGKQNIAVKGIFSSSFDALEYLRGGNPVDIVITDIEMPDMDGLAFIRAVQQASLCTGIIIISCHDNFAYAREAMELGVDSYILKQEVTEERLLEAIGKINAEKILPGLADRERGEKRPPARKTAAGDMSYAVGILGLRGQAAAEDSLLSGNVDKTMLIHLLESIVEKESMGTLFSPYNKETFILFTCPGSLGAQEKRALLGTYCTDLDRNLRLFINEPMVIGCGPFFDDLGEVNARYGECLEILELAFYEQASACLMPDQPLSEQAPELQLAADGFLEENWPAALERALGQYLDHCHRENVKVSAMKQELFAGINRLIYALAQKYSLMSGAILEHGANIEEIIGSPSREDLERRLAGGLESLRAELRAHLADDTMERVLQYIEEHVCEQLSLTEVAGKSYMSVPYFCKRFKEHTGETYVQYLSGRRVEKIKGYLSSGHHSLGEIAEEMHFQNTNYMIRLFKKVTGLTIREYKRSL